MATPVSGLKPHAKPGKQQSFQHIALRVSQIVAKSTLRLKYQALQDDLRQESLNFVQMQAATGYSVMKAETYANAIGWKDFLTSFRNKVKEETRKNTPSFLLNAILWQEKHDPLRQQKVENRKEADVFELIESATRTNPDIEKYIYRALMAYLPFAPPEDRQSAWKFVVSESNESEDPLKVELD